MFLTSFCKPKLPNYPDNIGVFPVDVEELTAEEYNSVIEQESSNVVSSEFVPARIGDIGNLGKFRVRYRMPVMPFSSRKS